MGIRLNIVHLVGAAALCTAGSAFAQAASSQTSAQPPAAAQSVDMNEVICEKQEVIGSRLAKKRVCRTRAEWADAQRQDRQEIDRQQVQRGKISQ